MRYSPIKGFFSLLSALFPTMVTRILFKHFLGYKLDMKKPQTLNEKMQYLKLTEYKNNKLITECVDKFLVRDVVSRKIGNKYLTNLYGVWNNADEIDFAELPDSFVLKCNHGSGMNFVCSDKSKLDIEKCRVTLNNWLRRSFGNHRAEIMYRGIRRKIICEEFINTSDGKPPKDYKFFCSNGKVKFLFVATDRIDDCTKFDYFYPNWEWIPVMNGHPNSESHPPKPDNLDEMIKIAEELSISFPFVRVDLYNENGRILFGELTFLHFAGLTPFKPAKYDYIFGELIDL